MKTSYVTPKFIKYIFSKSVNSWFLFSFFILRFLSYVIHNFFSLNAPPTPYRPSKTFFSIKLGSANKNNHLRDFKDALLKYGVRFGHFANFNLAHF